MNRRIWLLVLMALLAGGPAHAAGEPIIRAALPPGGPFLVGQPVILDVRVFVPNFFLSAPQFPSSLDLPGAVVTLADDRAQNLTETIGGQAYAGIRRAYRVVPQQEGRFTLPAAQIGFAYAAIPGQRSAGSVSLPALTFETRLPAGAAGPNGPVPVVPLVLAQSFLPDPSGLAVGDSLTRIVTITAAGLPAMMIPPPAIGTPDGVKPYRHDSVLSDAGRDAAGALVGRRTDRVTYVFQRSGTVVLPAVGVAWFDPARGTQQTARAPELRLIVAEMPAAGAAIAPDPPAGSPRRWFERIDRRVWLAGGLGVMALLGVPYGLRWILRLHAAWLARRRAFAHSEPACFKRLIAACDGGNRQDAYRALGNWVQVAGAGPISAWVSAHGTAELRAALAGLEGSLFSSVPRSDGWDGPGFAAGLTSARRRWIARKRVPARAALPVLNDAGARATAP